MTADPPGVATGRPPGEAQRELVQYQGLRERCDELLGNPLVVPAYPRYLSGFVHALEPVPGLAEFVVYR